MKKSRAFCGTPSNTSRKFFFDYEGRNPATINNYGLQIWQRINVSPGVSITVGSFILQIQAK